MKWQVVVGIWFMRNYVLYKKGILIKMKRNRSLYWRAEGRKEGRKAGRLARRKKRRKESSKKGEMVEKRKEGERRERNGGKLEYKFKRCTVCL